MPDVFSKKKRSEIMSKIPSKNTGIEKTIFSYLRKNGIYFQKHYRKTYGSPDIAIPSKKIAIFINGDFWHGYKFNSWKNRMPKKYWQNKILSNITRDRRNYAKLRRQGWRVKRVWGHQILKDPDYVCEKIALYINR